MAHYLQNQIKMNPKLKPSGWKYDENGRVSNRTFAELIISSLYYAKPRVISENDYDRAIDIAEEEINVTEVLGNEYLKGKMSSQHVPPDASKTPRSRGLS